ncbi:MAG: sodium:proton antiporter NhaD [Bacteroidota bacterium]|nr:sodium:proton antiporter NhaD [Bacteroidota bacterium]
MLIATIFIAGYLFIVFEHMLKLNKAASALLTGVLCWTVYIVGHDHATVNSELLEHLGEISGIIFFLLGAMTVVELIDTHDGFDVITSRITTLSRKKLLVIVALLSFFLSALLDNLTTAIVMMSLLRKLVRDDEDRMYYGGMVIIAANAGGAWSPIGDVTTTMLWVNGQITTGNIILKLFIPSLVCALVPLLWMSLRMKGNIERPEIAQAKPLSSSVRERNIVFISGAAVLILVPVFKTLTGLPPFMGILAGLAILWTITEFIHKKKNDEERTSFSVAAALQRVDTQSVLFFLGILLAISALESNGMLSTLAQKMDSAIANINIKTLSIGLSSAVVDNVPLVAAAQGMYPLSVFPTDDYFWEFLAYCAGTGGSILIIGSAAGIAVMGLEKMKFGWYLKKISFPALLGYFAGALVYIGMEALF